MKRTSMILALALAVVALAVAGCGSDDSSSSGGGGGGGSAATPESTGGGAKLAVAADPGGALKFTGTKLTAKAGKVEVDFDNPASVPHAVEIEGNGVEVKTDVVTGGKATVSADLKPGTYEFYCPVDGHRAAGMEGTLTVK